MKQKKIVIIGAGIVGCSTAYYLSKMGQTDITVIEQGPLFETGGSTSHAPGLVFQLNSSKLLTKLANDTVDCFLNLSNEQDLPSFYQVGSIEIASTPERMKDLKRKAGLAASWGIQAKLLTPEECSEKCELLNVEQIEGGLFVPTDGIAKPLRAIEKMAEYTKKAGTSFYGNTEVTDVEVIDGKVKAAETTKGRFEADLIICCAGFWGPRIGEMVNVTIPLLPMAHQYVMTSDLELLTNKTEEVEMPLIRQQDHALYYRQIYSGLGIGSYQHRSMPIELSTIPKSEETKDMPSVKPFTVNDFEKPWTDAKALFPSLKKAAIKKGINGIFSFTPDGMPLLGESRNVKGFWVAEAVWVTHSAGVGKAMAEWIINGTPSLDLEFCDINRFDQYALTPAYYRTRSMEQFEKVYDIHHPFMPQDTARNIQVTSYLTRQKDLEATFTETSGWEQAQWYSANKVLLPKYEDCIPERKGWEAKYWSQAIGIEHLHTRKHVAMYDFTAKKKRLEISGEDALELLQLVTVSDVDTNIGDVTHTVMLTDRGTIKGEVTVIRMAVTKFLVLCASLIEESWIKRFVKLGSSVFINDVTSETCSFGLVGPKSTALAALLTELDLTKWDKGKAKEVAIQSILAIAIHDSYVGEEGWEFIVTMDNGLPLWDLIDEIGKSFQIIAAGNRAYESLRIESKLPRGGKDYWSEHDIYEAGLVQMLSDGKTNFIGMQALEKRKERGSQKLLIAITFQDPKVTVMGFEPVYVNGEVKGFITSADYGYSNGVGVAQAWLEQAEVERGKQVWVEYFGNRIKATIETESIITI
ncbi:FAD-dependent oxidoreductase [Alkalihalobacillus sp. MEB130]|uniref:GcvT family protein n=1 Tax=Alkalihalobacillus sp. MEB130 TaxID=2976704 RepID=UPI0028DE187F|nr:FAD-dependent oxidoreductase [Alkalihalobacillus sp. MEB130]MDT8861307.1 FAD-dependent oxidoreductase [Alkalihalobacillus sp. MEB130]